MTNPVPTQVAYHGTRQLLSVLQNGLHPESGWGHCKHVCLAARPELAANFGTVLRVDISGLPVVWERGEGRIHAGIPKDRLKPLGVVPEASWGNWEDPAVRINHIACLIRAKESIALHRDT